MKIKIYLKIKKEKKEAAKLYNGKTITFSEL
jgi:hypothetical protein